MRECFKKNKIPSPDFFEADENYIDLFQKNEAPEIHFPKVVKPVDNMGARGCRLVRNKDEFLPALSITTRNFWRVVNHKEEYQK